MHDISADLVKHLKKGKLKSQSRIHQIRALLTAEALNGPVFGTEGKLVASMLEHVLEIAADEALHNPTPKRKKVEDTANHQAAAGVLKHIETTYEQVFSQRFDCHYGYHVPMLRRLLDKGETVDGLKHLAEAWISAGKGELVHGDNYRNARIWGDATIKAFAFNLNQIKSYAKPPKTPTVEWVMPQEATS